MTLTKALLLEDEKQIDWVRHYFFGCVEKQLSKKDTVLPLNNNNLNQKHFRNVTVGHTV